MQVDVEGIENMFITSIICDYGIEQKNSKNTKIEMTPFHSIKKKLD